MPPGTRYRWPDGSLHSTPYPVDYKNPYANYQPYTKPVAADPRRSGSNWGLPTGWGGTSAYTLNNPHNVSEAELMEELRTKYPHLLAFMNVPDVANAIKKAAKNGWGVDELYGEITQTSWWKSSSDNDRSYQVLLAEDPATAARMAGESAAKIQNQARTLGIPLSNDQIMALARDVTRFGWNDEQITDRLIKAVSWSQLEGGDLKASYDMVKRLGSEYLVRVSDATARDYALALASGEMTPEGVSSVMQRQSLARFGWMSDQIESGVTPRQYLAPVRDEIATELELAPEEIDLMDPNWLGMVEVHDQETGKMRAATMHEARLGARRDPRWRDTTNAGTMMASAAQGIAAAMGRRAL